MMMMMMMMMVMVMVMLIVDAVTVCRPSSMVRHPRRRRRSSGHPLWQRYLQLFLLAACKGEVVARILAVDACFNASGLFWLSRHWNNCNEFNFADSFCLAELIIKRTCLLQQPDTGMPLRLAFATLHCQVVVVLAVPVMFCSQLLRKQHLALIECHSLGCFLRWWGWVADI